MTIKYILPILIFVLTFNCVACTFIHEVETELSNNPTNQLPVAVQKSATGEHPIPFSDPDPTRIITGTSSSIIVTPIFTLYSSLESFPVNIKNFWVYSFTYHNHKLDTDEVLTTTYVITNSFVNTHIYSSYLAVEVKQEVKWAGNTSPDNFPEPIAQIPSSKQYWYVISGTNVYRQRELDFSAVDKKGRLQYQLPSNYQARCWYPLPDARATLSNYPRCQNWGYRYLEGPVTVNVPAGNFDNCYQFTEVWRGAGINEWICPNVGFVKKTWRFSEYMFEAEYEQILTEYSLHY